MDAISFGVVSVAVETLGYIIYLYFELVIGDLHSYFVNYIIHSIRIIYTLFF